MERALSDQRALPGPGLERRYEELPAEGHFARVLQHEIDHLNGVLLIDRAVDGLYTREEDDEGEEDDGGSGGGGDAARGRRAVQHERRPARRPQAA